MADKLIVTGLGRLLDGEYEFDISALLTPGHAEFLTYREWHRVKVMAGVRAGEIGDAFAAGDTDVNLALAAVILARNGRTVDEEKLWDAPGTSELRFVIEDREPADGDDVGDPPVGGPLESVESGSHSNNGGESSRPTLVSPATDQSRTGSPVSATSDRAT